MAMSIKGIILSSCFVLKQSNHEIFWIRFKLSLKEWAYHFVIDEIIVEIIVALVEGVEYVNEQVSIVVELNRNIWKESPRCRHWFSINLKKIIDLIDLFYFRVVDVKYANLENCLIKVRDGKGRACLILDDFMPPNVGLTFLWITCNDKWIDKVDLTSFSKVEGLDRQTGELTMLLK